MCEPVTIFSSIAAAVAIATAVTSAVASSNQAKAQTKANRRAQAASDAAAFNVFVGESSRMLQEKDAASNQLFSNTIEKARAKGRTVVSAGEGGISLDSLSLVSLVRDIEFIGGRNESIILNNLYNEQLQSNVRKKAAAAEAAGFTASLPFPLDKGSAIASAALQGVSGIAKSYGSYLQLSLET